MSERLRVIYFARRHQFFEPEHFVMRWRQHGIFAKNTVDWSGVTRYEQNIAIATPSEFDEVPGALSSIDGVGLFEYRDVEGYRKLRTADGQRLPVLMNDERQTFDDVLRPWVSADSSLAGSAGCAVKLVSLVYPALDGVPSLRSMLDLLCTQATLSEPARASGISKLVVANASQTQLSTGDPDDAVDLRSAVALLELGFASLDTFVSFLRDQWFRATVLPAWRSVSGPGTRTVAVGECCLYDVE